MTDFMELHVDKFTFKVATDRLYTAEGVWALVYGGAVRVGISDFTQQRSGDVAFAEVKPEGTLLKIGDGIAEVETIKVNLSLTSPAAGKIARVNPLMETAPETINQDPYGEGWLCEIEAADWEADHKNMLDPAAYFEHIQRSAEDEVKEG